MIYLNYWDFVCRVLFGRHLFRTNKATKSVKLVRNFHLNVTLFLFSCCKIYSSTEKQKQTFFESFFKACVSFCATAVGWHSASVHYLLNHKWNFVVYIGDWTSDIFSQWNFVVRAPDWSHLGSLVLFTKICAYKSQYQWNKYSSRLSFDFFIGRDLA